MPTTDTVVIAASGGDYTSLFSAEAAEQGDYVTADKIMEYSHQLAGDTTAVTFSGSTTDATRYIRVFAPSGWRHSGVWDASKSYIDTSNTAISCTDSFIRLEGIQLKITGANKSGIAPTPSDGAIVKIDSCIVRCGGSAQNSFGIKCVYNSSGNRTLLVSNSSFYDWINGTNSASGIYVYNGWTAYCYACTVVNCYIGLYRLSFGATAIPTLIAKNNLIRSCTTAASGTFAAGTDYNATDNASMGYTVTGSGNTHDRVGAFFTFTDESGDDFSLADADGGAKRYGVDLSGDANLPFSTDITGATRSGTWDIGAHQHVSSAPTGTKFVRYIENLTAVTTTATALKSRCQLTLAAGDQAASTDYLIIGYAEVANATAGAKVDLHLVNVTDSVTYQDLEPAPALSTNGDNIAQTMYGVYTSASTPVEKSFEIRFAAVSGTAQIKNAHITVIKLEAADKYDETTAKIDSTTSYADAASVTFTPASQGFYWIFGATEALHSAGHLPRAQLLVGGTQQTAIEEVDTPSSSARTSLALSWVEELAASSQTLAFRVRDAGGSTDFYNTRVFALRLDGFPNYWYSEDTANDTTPATSFEVRPAAITQTFSTSKHLAVACLPARSSNTSSVDVTTSLRDDSTVVRQGKTRPRNTFGTEGTDSPSLLYLFNGSGSSKTIDAGWHFSGSASGNMQYSSLLIIQLESANQNINETLTFGGSTSHTLVTTVSVDGSLSFQNSSDLLRDTTINIAEALTFIAALDSIFIPALSLDKSLAMSVITDFSIDNLINGSDTLALSIIGDKVISSLINAQNSLLFSTENTMDLLTFIVGSNGIILANNVDFLGVGGTSVEDALVFQISTADLLGSFINTSLAMAASVSASITNVSNANVNSSIALEQLAGINQAALIVIQALSTLEAGLELSTGASATITQLISLVKQLSLVITEEVTGAGNFNESVTFAVQGVISQLSEVLVNNLLQLTQNTTITTGSNVTVDGLVAYLNALSATINGYEVVEKSLELQNSFQIQQVATSIYAIMIIEGIISSLDITSLCAVSGSVQNSITASLINLGQANVNSLASLSAYQVISQIAETPGIAPPVKDIFIRALELLDKRAEVTVVTDDYSIENLVSYYTILYQD